ncbi:MAG TPA: Smr/MutS family protein [Caldimonas sp.]|nr:Smr/MutS family protein [Caldimonas sp.]HEX2542059.1 Smr/MutS family protein [Caldimonas sp.]
MTGQRVKTHTLHDLAALRAALREKRAATQAAETQERQRATAEKRERDLFVRSVGTVLPLRRSAPALPERPRPSPVARQRQQDEAAVLAESISDEFDVESLLETDDALSFRRRGVGPDVVRKLRRGVWVTQAEVDLHGLRREAARERLAEFLREAARAGLRCVRVVHGKGLGSPGREPVLKAKVKTWLVQRQEVLAFTHARASDGGHGALVVLLQTASRPRTPA